MWVKAEKEICIISRVRILFDHVKFRMPIRPPNAKIVYIPGYLSQELGTFSTGCQVAATHIKTVSGIVIDELLRSGCREERWNPGLIPRRSDRRVLGKKEVNLRQSKLITVLLPF